MKLIRIYSERKGDEFSRRRLLFVPETLAEAKWMYEHFDYTGIHQSQRKNLECSVNCESQNLERAVADLLPDGRAPVAKVVVGNRYESLVDLGIKAERKAKKNFTDLARVNLSYTSLPEDEWEV